MAGDEKILAENKALKDQIKLLQESNRQSDRFSESAGQVGTGLGQWSLSIKDFGSAADKAFTDFGNAINALDLSAFEELDELGTTLQQEFGTSKEMVDSFKMSIADTTPELIRMGIEGADLTQNIAKIMNSLSTTATLGVEAITELSAAAKVTRVPIEQLATNFRDVGISIYDVGNQMKDVTDIARGAGVSVSAISSKVSENLNKMNLFNFDNGVKGLAKMAVTSERLGISMERVFTFADKIYDPEGAIEMAAGLQRLGVTASGLLDPLKAMDLAANDPEGLQKEIVNITKEFTKFNESNGKFEIMPGSKRRLREIAKEMGIPAEELASMSIKAADFDMKMKQIEFPSLATDQETKEMIAGMSQMKDGKAMINIKNEQTGEVKLKQVDQLTGSDLESLKKQQEDDSKSIEDVARDQLSVSKSIEMNTRSFITKVAYGKATTEPLEKLYGSIMGIKQDVTRNLTEMTKTEDIRNRYTSIAKPVENYMVAGIKGDEEGKKMAEKDFVSALYDVEGAIRANGQKWVQETVTDISKRFSENYMQPTKVETKTDVNFNMTINGNDNVKNMDLNSVKNEIVTFLTQTAEGKDLLKKAIENKNAPSAATGSKI